MLEGSAGISLSAGVELQAREADLRSVYTRQCVNPVCSVPSSNTGKRSAFWLQMHSVSWLALARDFKYLTVYKAELQHTNQFFHHSILQKATRVYFALQRPSGSRDCSIFYQGLISLCNNLRALVEWEAVDAVGL